MKKANFILTCLLVLSISLRSQNDKSTNKSYNYNPSLGNGVFREESKTSKIEGSPYLISDFKLVEVEKIQDKTKMRYNVYKDEFEFISAKNDTLILDKKDDFKNLKFTTINTNYKLINYLNSNDQYQYGYLIDLYQKNDFGLFKKENIQLTEEKLAKTTLEQNKPAKYLKVNDIFFLKNKEKISEFPSNKKRLFKIFPNHKESLEVFIKENKIDFEKETDKIKIINFLSTL